MREAGGFVTDVRDRDYFNAIYFREPRGILFEIATLSLGFAADEDPETLGEALRLPKQHEHLRAHLEQSLQPVVNPRTAQRSLPRRPRRRDERPDLPGAPRRERGARGPAGAPPRPRADDRDLLSLGDVLDPQQRLHVVTPRAPLTLQGWPGYHWYVVPRVGYPDPETFAAARAKLSAFHDELWSGPGSRRRGRSSAASRWAR